MLKLIAVSVGVLVLQACNGQAEQAVDDLILSDPAPSALRTQIGDEQPAQHHGRVGR